MNAAAPLRRSAYTHLCSSLIFPLHEKLKHHDSTARLRALEQSQWWAPEALARQRVDRLRAFLVRVGASVPYYGALFRRVGFDPAHVKTLEDLAALPLLTKTLIRSNTDALKSRHASGLIRYNTGGSSGEPLIFYMGNDRVSHDVAAKWRATRW
ncbi:MAG: phenylacetate--CoA ligase family protein, partial [Pseudomonadota bacterium]